MYGLEQKQITNKVNMKQRVNQYDFEQAFRSHGRFGGDHDNFSYEALQLLFEYFEELEDSCDTEIELDVIAICCDYCEMSKSEIYSSYGRREIIGIEYEDPQLEEQHEEQLVEWLNDHTQYIGKTELSEYSKLKEPTFVYQSF